jgi:hypothetical protein
MQAVLVKTQHTKRGVVTLGVLEDVGEHPDLPESMRTRLQALLDAATDAEKAGGVVAANLTSKSVMNDLACEKLWGLLHAVEVIAAATELSAEAKAALSMVKSEGGYTAPNCRKRAKRVRAALSKFPATFSASGKTRDELIAEIDAMFAADLEEDNLRVDLRTANQATKDADKALDQENKRIYKILRVCFPKGSREWNLVQGIPTDTPAKSTVTTTTSTSGMTLPKK